MTRDIGAPIADWPIAAPSETTPIAADQLGWATPAASRVANATPQDFEDFIARLDGDVATAVDVSSDCNRDWWPAAMTWLAQGKTVGQACVGVAPTSIAQLQSVLRAANATGVPIVPAAGRSGVNAGTTAPFPFVALDLTRLDVTPTLNNADNTATVSASMPGDAYESWLNDHGFTGGHFPQSIALSTVGGWLACRSAGQLSNAYGKIEDLVQSMTVVLADGSIVETGFDAPRSAVGSDLTQLLVGSEGTLGIIVSATLLVFRAPADQWFQAFALKDFNHGVRLAQSLAQSNALPAVLRIYDDVEAMRHFNVTGALAIAVDQGDVDAMRFSHNAVSLAAQLVGATSLGSTHAETWWQHRNNVSALVPFVTAGAIVDTIEASVSWQHVDHVYQSVCDRLRAMPGIVSASAHISHEYSSGAGIYFTFGGFPPDTDRPRSPATDMRWYQQAIDSVCDVVASTGGAISHHHGVGRVRASAFVRLNPQRHALLQTIKTALDPNGILNPGVLGLW
jgi:alkyldihydroxyacetonephosphate synthase